jgi:hypothetical protein
MITKTRDVRKSTTVKGTFTISDVYDISNQKYKQELFEDAISSYLKHAVDYVLDTGMGLKLGSNLGELVVRKEKVEFIIRDNGKVYTNCFVDARATNELKKTKEPNEKVTLIRHLDMEYLLKPIWFKGMFKNATAYYFKSSPYFSKKLYEKAINNDTIDINELHQNTKFNREDK